MQKLHNIKYQIRLTCVAAQPSALVNSALVGLRTLKLLAYLTLHVLTLTSSLAIKHTRAPRVLAVMKVSTKTFILPFLRKFARTLFFFVSRSAEALVGQGRRAAASGTSARR